MVIVRIARSFDSNFTEKQARGEQYLPRAIPCTKTFVSNISSPRHAWGFLLAHRREQR
jgi:hypothetical protein